MIKTPQFLIENKNRISNLKPQSLGPWNANYDNPIFESFGEYAEFKQRFPEKTVTRQDIVNLFAKGDVYQGFIAAMVWGYINASRPRTKGGGRESTDFYKALSHPKSDLVDSIHAAQDWLMDNDLAMAFNHFMPSGKYKIPGVSYRYFTKIFFFLGEANPAIATKPLIFDKWTQNAFFSLLLQSYPSETKDFFRGLKAPTKEGTPGEALVRSGKKLTQAYERYVFLMNQWAAELGVSAGDLELFVFGQDLRKDPSVNNPRRELWKICSSSNG
ncbi:hypothetical protein OAK70_02445 [Akkermansiaceae bacterium]|nr:hypothetical protein [Akkermansiaceae bacterium]MDB4698276.1 hypothetical protein [Akkermansiaceae bacterium]MDC0271036.1 hypothetical protein [Akkermansiaceae bacterium]